MEDKLNELIDFIESEVKRIYEVGYHHGWNISRPHNPKKVDEGWGEHFEIIKEKVLEYEKE